MIAGSSSYVSNSLRSVMWKYKITQYSLTSQSINCIKNTVETNENLQRIGSMVIETVYWREQNTSNSLLNKDEINDILEFICTN
jgi:hypothetical protein